MRTAVDNLTTKRQGKVQFARGIPPTATIPSAELAHLTKSVLEEEQDTVFQYAPLGRFQGSPVLREQLGVFHEADPDSIFVGNGSLQVLDLLTAYLLEKGNPTVFVEAPDYDRALAIFERHGGHLVDIPMQADGVDLARFEEKLRSSVPAFFYTIPDFQNPTGITMSLEKRQALVALAAKHGFAIVEDVPYRALRYHGVAPPMIRTLAGDARVITVGSLSKVISPGLRIGYAICDPPTAQSIALMAENTYLSPSPLCQAIAARGFISGLIATNIQRIRQFLRMRHDAAIQSVRRFMDDSLIAVPNGGYFLGLQLRIGADDQTLLAAASEAGITLTPGSGFYPRHSPPPAHTSFLRIPFQALEPGEFAIGIERLRDIVRQLSN